MGIMNYTEEDIDFWCHYNAQVAYNNVVYKTNHKVLGMDTPWSIIALLMRELKDEIEFHETLDLYKTTGMLLYRHIHKNTMTPLEVLRRYNLTGQLY